jgi:arylsulfatase A-like enzyme
MTAQRACLLSLILIAGRAMPLAAAQPNIVFIMADDAGLGDFGFAGGTVIPTPHIDRLAAEGMTFTNAYSGSAVCAPTRCVLMTGQHTGHGTRRANQSRDGLIPLADEQVTVAELLHEAGYATGGFGKWGLGNPGTAGVPEKQGFDLFYGYYDQTHAHNYFPAFLIRNSVEIPMPGGNGVSGKAGRGDAYSHELIVAETLAFIEQHRHDPFFCYAAWTLPHGNFEIPSDAPFSDRTWPQPVKNRAAMLARLDSDVGRLLQRLRDLELDGQTVVVFTSDNGADGPGITTFGSTAGLRGKKRSLYEGGIRAPFLVRWTEHIRAGSTSDHLTSHVDFLATACDLAGRAPPPGTDGVSLVPVLLESGPSTDRASLYWEIYEGPAPFQQAVRTEQWKGYRTAMHGPLELYDLSQDPTESHNIADRHPDVVTRIEEILIREHVANPHWIPVMDPAPGTSRKSASAR